LLRAGTAADLDDRGRWQTWSFERYRIKNENDLREAARVVGEMGQNGVDSTD